MYETYRHIDTNLLILLIVGSTSINFIEKHKRLQKYSVDDYRLLVNILSKFSQIVVVPHVLAETSNFLAHIENPIKGSIFRQFRIFIEMQTEHQIASVSGARQPEFAWLGLTDAILIEAAAHSDREQTILTDDLRLADAASRKDLQCVNFNHRFN
jgi:predicted nucleic acid-binding protein